MRGENALPPPIGNWPSGEALKSAESLLLAKVADRQIAFGDAWEDVVRFALAMAGGPDVVLSCQWADATARSDLDRANIAVLKQQVGYSQAQLWREFGMSEGEIARMRTEREEEGNALQEAATRMFGRGQ